VRGVVKFKDGKDGWEIREIQRPEPKPGEVEIQVQAAGMCGSELHLYHDNHSYTPPVVVGHEFCGVISRVGEGVTKWKVGDRVVAENHKTVCGACEYCRTGLPVFCAERRTPGYHVDGGWTSYFTTPIRTLIKIPDNVSFEEAALTEPISVAVEALVERVPVKAGEIVLVHGCGPIGLLNAMVAKAAGAGQVIITGIDDDEGLRLSVARELGIDRVININKTDLKKEVMEITNGCGVDMIVEASGAESAINSSFGLIRKRGRIVAIGEAAKPEITFRWNDAIFRGCSIVFSFGSTYKAWTFSLDLVATGQINVKPLITHKFPLDKWEEGFKLMDAKESLKVLLIPDDSTLKNN
jgi:L-iditol 2-dehydrogenase